MRKQIFGLLLLGGLLWSSCGGGNDGNLPHVPDYSHEIVQVGQFEIEVDSTVGRIPLFSDVAELNGIECMAILNGYENTILLYPLSGEGMPDGMPSRIPIDRGRIGNVKSFHFAGRDSVYLLTKGPSDLKPKKDRELHLVNWQGQLIDSVAYADKIHLLDPDGVVDLKSEQLFANQSLPIKKYGDNLFVGLLPYFREELDRPVSGQINLGSGDFSYHQLSLDSGSVGGDFVYQLATRAIDTVNSMVALGYRGTPVVQAYDWEKGTLERKAVRSDFLSLEAPPQPFEEGSVNGGGIQGVSQENQLLDHGEYGRLLASPKGYFCRVVYFANQDSLFMEKYGTRTSINNRFCSIIAFSHKFRKLMEMSVGDGIVDRNAGFAKNGTLYIQDFIPAEQFRGKVKYLKYNIVERTSK